MPIKVQRIIEIIMKWYYNIKILLSINILYGLIKVFHLYYKIVMDFYLIFVKLCVYMCIVIILHKCNLCFLHILFYFIITTVLEIGGVGEICFTK